MTGEEGYLLAKRQVQTHLKGRIEILRKKLDTDEYMTSFEMSSTLDEIRIIEKVRNYLRNSLLWDSNND